MWRSVFLAIGITLCIVGFECLFVDGAVLAKPAEPQTPAGMADAALGIGQPQSHEIKMKEWMPWSFLGAGAVIILYTINLPRRFQGP
jgi:hypothetical protein